MSLILLLVLAAGPARAQQRDEDAKAAYTAGKAAYEAKRFDEALERFNRSYVLSGQAALLYNIASTLQQLNRPGNAAETLRDYLKARPTDSDRGELETRIADLTMAQQILDRDKHEKDKLLAEQEARMARERAARVATDGDLKPLAGWLSEAESDRRLELVKLHEKKRRRGLGIGLGVGVGLLVVGGALALGFCLGTKACSSPEVHNFDFGKMTVTP